MRSKQEVCWRDAQLGLLVRFSPMTLFLSHEARLEQEERWAMLAVAVDVCEGIYLDESKERERLCEVKRSEYARTVALCRRHAYESEPHEVREFLDQQTEEHRNEVLDDLVYLKVLKAKLSRSERRDVERE